MGMRTMQINSIVPATQLVTAGDGPTLIANTDINNVLWLGNDVGVVAGRPDTTVSLSPQSWMVVDGDEDVYGITNPGVIIAVEVIQHGLSYFQSGISGGGFQANNNGAFFYDGIPGTGNLIMSITGTNASGIDTFGNPYTPGGVCIVGEPAATNLFNVVDQSVPPNTLAQIGSDGSITSSGTMSADVDMYIGGSSFLNDILPSLAKGLIGYGGIPAASLPFPAVANANPILIQELDVQTVAGRRYMLVVGAMQFNFATSGGCQIVVYATSDGSTPTTSSPIVTRALSPQIGAGGIQRTNPLVHTFNSLAGGLWRFLLYCQVYGGATTQQLQVLEGTETDDADGNLQCRMSVYDMGLALSPTGLAILTSGSSGGTTPKQYTKTYTATASHSYQGNDGGNPNLKINDNGIAYQGGDRSNTYNGRAKTWYEFNTGTIQSDLAGSTINKFEIYLNNNHSWYNSGMTAAIGYDNITGAFGSTRGNPAGVGVDLSEVHFNEGQAKWSTISNSFGSAFRSGAALQIVLFKDSNSLTFYGYFAGSGSCQIRITYTK